MSMDYWAIQGIGLCVNEIEDLIDKEKAVRLIYEFYPDETISDMILRDDFSDFDISEYVDGEPFENLGDFLTFCDDTDSITYGTDGDGHVFFYYPPSMPWERHDHEPSSPHEVVRRIVNAVQKISNLSEEKIEKMIDTDLFVVGCG